MKPVIGMSLWRRKLPTFLGPQTDLFTLATEYVESIEAHDAATVLLTHYRPEDAPGVVDRLDAVVICGGNDIDPSFYGAPLPDNPRTHDPAADASELALVRAAVDTGKPVFGICRGIQVVNVALGGTLHQDISVPGTDHPPFGTTPEELLGHRHEVILEPGSQLSRVYGSDRVTTNSIHHQAVDRVAPGLKVTGRATDGTIEVLEPEDPEVPLIAVQWHPEKVTIEGHDLLFAAFVDLVRNGKA